MQPTVTRHDVAEFRRQRRGRARRKPGPDSLPPFPWTVEWVGGFAYAVGADGRRFAVLLGSQKRRECVADLLCRMTDRN